MSTLSGLKDTCREYVGHRLGIRFVYGWGWTIEDEAGARTYEDIDAVNGTCAEVIPSTFFAYESASTRGFLGRIISPGHPLDEQPLVAFTMSDGFDYDFTATIRPVWRFWIGEGELFCPPNLFPLLRGPRVIGGYGFIATTKASLQST